MQSMASILVIVVGVLAAAVGYLLSQLRNKPSVVEEREPEVRVDTDSIVTAVKEAVDAQVNQAAQAALKTNNELAGQLIDERTRTLRNKRRTSCNPSLNR